MVFRKIKTVSIKQIRVYSEFGMILRWPAVQTPGRCRFRIYEIGFAVNGLGKTHGSLADYPKGAPISLLLCRIHKSISYPPDAMVPTVASTPMAAFSFLSNWFKAAVTPASITPMAFIPDRLSSSRGANIPQSVCSSRITGHHYDLYLFFQQEQGIFDNKFP